MRIEALASDSQIVAQLWEQCGVELLSLLEGMFALAIWDRKRQKLWLVSDRTGCRTLYYTTHGAARWHGKQLRSLLETLIPDYLLRGESVGVFLSGVLNGEGGDPCFGCY